MTLRRWITCLALCSLPLGALACGGAPDDELGASNDEVITGVVTSGRTTTFRGTFSVDTPQGAAKFEFDVTRIDWRALTARWDAKVLEGAGATDDVGLGVAIQLARCPGCFTFVVRDGAETLAELAFSNGTLSGLRYSGQTARAARITKVEGEGGAAGGGAAGGGAAGGSGACSLVCGGSAYDCKEGLSESACNASAFSSRPRCPHTFEFKAGARCGAR